MRDIPNSADGADANFLGRTPLRFAGLALDLDACALARDSGEPVPLTRGEFALLRVFASRPGRVLSREALLDAVAGRNHEPFDRSVDVMVARLRRKIEPDPKAPSLIVTVPGEGYRFDGLKVAPAKARAETADPAPAASESCDVIAPDGGAPPAPSAQPVDAGAKATESRPSQARLAAVLAAAVILALVAGAVAWRAGLLPHAGTAVEDKFAAATRLSIVVLPFENLSGDPEQEYFADGLTDDLTTDLSHLQDSFHSVFHDAPPSQIPGSRMTLSY